MIAGNDLCDILSFEIRVALNFESWIQNMALINWMFTLGNHNGTFVGSNCIWKNFILNHENFLFIVYSPHNSFLLFSSKKVSTWNIRLRKCLQNLKLLCWNTNHGEILQMSIKCIQHSIQLITYVSNREGPTTFFIVKKTKNESLRMCLSNQTKFWWEEFKIILKSSHPVRKFIPQMIIRTLVQEWCIQACSICVIYIQNFNIHISQHIIMCRDPSKGTFFWYHGLNSMSCTC
jgi:hypothetical protein